jgi:predicted hotdog family 3-hydroxylacyl-ACP dehydratase
LTPTIEELVPHRGPLSLLGRVVAWAPGNVRCHADLRPDNPLLAPDGTFPAWALVEVVAQAAAALRGLEALDAGSTPTATQAPGYLVAVRDARFAARSIPVGARLQVEVRREGEPRLGMATLRGEVDWQGRTVCEVTLTVKES